MRFYTPKDFKKGRLIFSKYRPIDLIVLIATAICFLTLTLAYLLSGLEINVLIIVLLLLPIGVAFILLMNFGVYHNILTYLYLLINFKSTSHKYIWGGIRKYEKQD